jgi:hypothetical protein
VFSLVQEPPCQKDFVCTLKGSFKLYRSACEAGRGYQLLDGARRVDNLVSNSWLRINLWHHCNAEPRWPTGTITSTPRLPESEMAIFIALKRPGPPAKEVLVNLDQILMVQQGQGSGSAILFGREHLVSFEEDVPTVIRRIQTGPYIRTDPG